MHKDVSRSLFQRSWSIVGGLLTTFSVPVFLTANQQGYFYTFSSVIAIQIFFELGLSQVLLYKFASIVSPAGENPPKQDRQRLTSLLYVARRFYIVISLLFFFAALIGGYLFLSTFSVTGVEWRPIWFCLVLATSINLAQSIKLVFLESQGFVADVATLRLKTGLGSTVIFLVVLALGAGLWAAVVVPSVNALVTSLWIYKSRKALSYRHSRILDSKISARKILQTWRVEIFPLQWRTSISWISGYFIFQLITPIAFNRFGPEVAGHLGFAISAMNSILFVSTTFTSSVSPRLSTLFHSFRIEEFNLLFDASFRRSVIAVLALSQLFVLALYMLSIFNEPFANRFLSWDLALLYSPSVILSAIVYCWAIYLRSQAIEPLVIQSAITALVMAPVLWLASSVSVGYMLGGMLIVSLFSSVSVWKIYSVNRAALASLACGS
jgi:hypothetical protein